MTEFKNGDRIVFTKDDAWWERGELVARMPAGTLGTYLGTRAWRAGAPWVRLDTGEYVRAWATRIAHAEDHGTGDGSASDIAARRESTPPYEATTNPDGSVTARSNLRFVPDAPQQVEDSL